jgi:segregation and condensation protein B
MKEKNLVEAALIMAEKPIPIEEIMKLVKVDKSTAEKIIEELRHDYKDRSMEIVYTHEGLALRVKSEFQQHVSHLTPYADISPGPLRTLAIIAYKQPVKQSDIVKVQGNRVYEYVKDLLERGLINSKRVGKTNILTTTPAFESYFGKPAKTLQREVKVLEKEVKAEKKIEEDFSDKDLPEE